MKHLKQVIFPLKVTCTIAYLIFFIGGIGFAQITIKDTIAINFGSGINRQTESYNLDNISSISLPQIDCGGYGDIYNQWDDAIFVPRFGGKLRISYFYDWGHPGEGDHWGYEDILLVYNMSGQCIGSYGLYDINNIDTVIDVNQWGMLRFRNYIKNFRLNPDLETYSDTVLKANYISQCGCLYSGIVTDMPSSVEGARGVLAFRWRDPFQDSLNFKDYANLYNLTFEFLDSIPAASVPSNGPPFNSDNMITFPYDGTYRLIIRSGSAAHDDLKMLSPKDSILLNDAQSHVGDTLILGPYTAGTQLQLATISHTGSWNGSLTYPCTDSTYIGQWSLSFESWSDLYFDDLGVSVEWNVGDASGIEIYADSDVVNYGDTVQFFVRAVDSAGIFMPLSGSYIFYVSILDTTYGTLMNDGITGTDFSVVADSGVGKWFQFIANGRIPVDSLAQVPFYLLAIDTSSTGIGLTKRGNGESKLNAYPPSRLSSEDDLKVKINSILLGETIFYHGEIENGKLKIKENTKHTDEGVTGLQFYVDIYPVDPANDGKRLGVYYEYRDPSGNPINASQQIRLIGRYWSADSNYFVKLSATNGTMSGQYIIEVKKPGKIGVVKDNEINVFGQTYNLDEKIIEYAGKYGVLPQILKGQIEQESSFNPAYRYEPFYEAASPSIHEGNRIFYGSRYRIIGPGDIGDPGLPTDHTNVHPHYYYGYQGTIGDIVFANCSDVNPDYHDAGDYDMYNSHGKKLWSEEALEIYFEIWDEISKDLYANGTPTQDAIRAAKDTAFQQFENKYAVGTLKEIAQTRIAASYGLLQILYPSGVRYRNYPTDADHLPENLMEVDRLFQYAVPFINNQLGRELQLQGTSEQNNWPQGFEMTFRATLNFYNKGFLKKIFPKRYLNGTYGENVMTKSNNYLPTKE
jgi:hypothetical protein